ncbi:MAG: CPBP family glutamic-type intramembrane protease [Aquificaceae bacterium]|nr:CPBP family glutamic-type intramembrane protease [Aquificaceae bacterium]
MSIRRYSELLLYSLLILSLLFHKFYGLPNLSLFLLLLPLVFLPSDRFGLRSVWNLSLLLLPVLYLLYPKNFLGLSLQAFAEELFFRGYLMQSFSNLKVSFLFTIPHVILYGDLWSWLTFFPSLFYGFAYRKTSSLALVTVLHLSSNVLWFRFLNPLLS